MSDYKSVAQKVFMNGKSELRSGWRVLVFLLLFTLTSILLTALMSVLGSLIPSLGNLLPPQSSQAASTPKPASAILISSLNLIAALTATTFCARALEYRSLASVGFKLHPKWLRDFALGFAFGMATIAVAVGAATFTGADKFHVQGDSPAFLARGFGLLFVMFLISAAFEELFFRGFPFQALVQGAGPASAIAITSAFFGLAHLSNPNATTFSTLNTVLAGIWLAAAYLLTRSLWLATALHFSWNFVMVFVFGLPVSGITTYENLAWLNGQAGSPVWLSGGGYGPEGGAAASVAIILSTLLIYRSGIFSVTEEMIAAQKHRPPRAQSLQSLRPDVE